MSDHEFDEMRRYLTEPAEPVRTGGVSIPLIALPGSPEVRIAWRPAGDHPLDYPMPVAAIGTDPNPFPRLRLFRRIQ